MSKFKVPFSFFFLLFQISGAQFSQAGKNFFSVQGSRVLFSGLLDNFEDDAFAATGR